MTTLSPSVHDTIVRHTLYGMLTRWIPVPFANFIAGNIVRRQMIASLAESHGAKLSSAAVKTLADEQLGCVYGCLINIVFFPIKLILGKLILLIRFKRFVDQASRKYHAARLYEYALRTKSVAPAGPHSAQKIRAAVDVLCETADIGPVSAAFKQVLKKKASVLKDAAGLFWRSLQSVQRRRNEEQVQQAVKEAELETSESVGGVLSPLRTALEAIPAEHFTRLESELEAMLRGSGEN